MTQPGPKGYYGGRSAADRRAERRARLLDAGLQMFGTVGYAMSPVGAICKAANLSNRQYYEEFADREALLIALYDDINNKALEAVSAALAELESPTFVDRVRTALEAYVSYTASDLRRAQVAYVQIVGVTPAIEAFRLEWRRRWVNLISELVRAAIERGEVHERDYNLAASAYVGAVNGLLQDWCAAEDRAPLSDVIAELTRIAAAAVAH